MRRTPDIEDQIKDLRVRLDLLGQRIEELSARDLWIPMASLSLKANGLLVNDHRGELVATCLTGTGISKKRALGNARLFAEAPQMLSILVRIKENYDRDEIEAEIEGIMDRVDGVID